MAQSQNADDDLKERLRVCCTRHLGDGTQLSDVQQLSGGASAETWRLVLQEPEASTSRTVILRRSGASSQQGYSLSVDKATEAAVQRVCGEAGVPVPPILFSLQESDGLGDGYVMESVDGETIPRRILRGDRFARARGKLAAQCGEVLGKIHQVDATKLDMKLPEQPASAQLRLIEMMYRGFKQPSPVFELALRWLERRAPAEDQQALVHGDFRNGNLIVDESGLAAVIDWELCHLGNPLEDLGWLCVNAWGFGSDKPVGGFGEIGDLLEAYENQTGVTVSPEQLLHWQVFGTLRWGVICMYQASLYLSGKSRSVELAMIGRRVSETEIDILNLLEKS